MVRILVVYHSQSGNTFKMVQAVVRGIGEIEGVRGILKKALETTEADLRGCNGLIIASPEYFGYMAGAVKDLFDRTYETLRGQKGIFRKPYALVISAGNDGQGALTSIEKICLGYQFKKVQPPIVSRGHITDIILAQCEELGRIMAAGCREGIY